MDASAEKVSKASKSLFKKGQGPQQKNLKPGGTINAKYHLTTLIITAGEN